MAQIRCVVGPVGCYSGDTEFFTPKGWVRFDEWKGQRVCQWDPAFKRISSVEIGPDAYIKEPCYEFIHFRDFINKISMVLSAEHRMLVINRSGDYIVRRADVVAEVCQEPNSDLRIPSVSFSRAAYEEVLLPLSNDTCDVRRVESLDGFKYCFTVPTGFLIVRHNGRVFISGNSGKTTGASWETQRYIPFYLYKHYGIRKTRGVIIRNTYSELIDTTQKTVFEWFGWGRYLKQEKRLVLKWDAPDGGDPIEVETLFRSCDNPEDVKKFKSLELTWYWVDESIEVADQIKRMLKNRIGRFPRRCPVRFGIETTNPPDVEHPTYSQFKWDVPPPGPIPPGKPLAKHAGFWQPPYENAKNLRPGYYEDLAADYADSPDWADMYIKGMPGQLVRGKLVYSNFIRDYHVALEPLKWGGQDLFRGWDNSGNTPACVVVCPVSPQKLHVLKEFTTIKESAVDFANRVKEACNISFPNARWTDYGDPAGKAQYSTREGTFTSNAQLMNDECGIHVISGEQNFKIRTNVVDQALLKRDGMLIDPGCLRLVNGFLGGYHYPELADMPGAFKKDPAKNKYSHIHEALQYVLTRLYVSAAPDISDRDVYPDYYEEPTY